MGSRSFNSATPDCLRQTVATITGVPGSVSIWFYPFSDTGVGQSLIGCFSSTTISRMATSIAPTTLFATAAVADTVSSSAATTTNAVTLNAWNHMCAVFASATLRTITLNGNIAARGSNAASRTATGLVRTSMGMRDYNTPDLAFNGALACPAIWNDTLADEEIAALAAGISPWRIRRNKLVWFVPYLSLLQEWLAAGAFTLIGAPAVSLNMPPVQHP